MSPLSTLQKLHFQRLFCALYCELSDRFALGMLLNVGCNNANATTLIDSGGSHIYRPTDTYSSTNNPVHTVVLVVVFYLKFLCKSPVRTLPIMNQRNISPRLRRRLGDGKNKDAHVQLLLVIFVLLALGIGSHNLARISFVRPCDGCGFRNRTYLSKPAVTKRLLSGFRCDSPVSLFVQIVVLRGVSSQ